MGADIKVLLMGLLVILLLAIYSFSNATISWKGSQIKKADFASLYSTDIHHQNTKKEAVNIQSSTPQNKESQIIYHPDSTQNILFIGDSMLEGLSKRFNDYAEENGHTLNTVIWYSSTSEQWAETDTLEYFINKFNPSYIVICLCSNELFVKDVDARKQSIHKLVGKIGSRPFVWISPPNWKEDTGINDAIIAEVGINRYFDSRSLDLERGRDNAHPTFSAAALWMDTIAGWLQTGDCAYPLKMNWPQKEVGLKNVTLLRPM